MNYEKKQNWEIIKPLGKLNGHCGICIHFNGKCKLKECNFEKLNDKNDK